MKRVADKYILADGSGAPGMSNEEFYRLEEKYYLEKARRWYIATFPKEMEFRSFCARVKREFMRKLVPTQRETIDRVCGAAPIPTLDQHLQNTSYYLVEARRFGWDLNFIIDKFDCLRPRYYRFQDDGTGFSSKDYLYVRIWRRIREDWGSVEPNTFEYQLEVDYQHDEREITTIDELRKHIRIRKPREFLRRF
jgi:hypothetical protein